jgi:hypothetical protein
MRIRLLVCDTMEAVALDEVNNTTGNIYMLALHVARS